MESTITKKAITYSLLAHIKNSGTLSDGPLDVFIPIVKKGLHLMNSKKVQCKGANISEISTIINEQYIIDIPIPVLRSVLKKIAKEETQRKKKYLNYITMIVSGLKITFLKITMNILKNPRKTSSNSRCYLKNFVKLIILKQRQ